MIFLKKIIILLFIGTVFCLFNNKSEEILIPNDAIRFRVIANSNTLKDQQVKLQIKNSVEKEVYSLISNAESSNEVRSILNNNIEKIENIVKQYNVKYKIDYGYNTFPAKNYKGILYPAGNYESLVITLGEGVGANFWCVLFPPLCLLDNEAEDVGDVEYQLYVKKILQKF